MAAVTDLKKVLVANRGEIAVRVLRACRELGLSTVAVYSEVDEGAPHTLLADEAYCLGPADPAQSYLNIPRIIDVAKLSGARAIHPGYGFLSENAAFARACVDAELVFIGPSAETIDLLGDKARARELALSADAPVVPGQPAPDPTAADHDEQLRVAAEGIGYPLMLKAAAGGGGKGMRVVFESSSLLDAYGSARREAKSAFGNDTMLLERFVQRPRHVEVQILADTHGNAIYLGERECSVQRRHQKIIEESPSPAVDSALRERMGQAALRIARQANYVNAGTVEFLLAPDGEFYFLEVNTRLQVEHPVTEMVTRVDLVHEQLRVAAGEALTMTQDDVVLRGHAVEVRLYAEDPQRDFAPSPGTIAHLYEPQLAGLRIDSGVRPGQTVPVNYDPILAKIIAWAPERAGAIARLTQGLTEYSLLGLTTNQSYLRHLLEHPAFQAGELTTNFIAEHFADHQAAQPSLQAAALAATLLSTKRGARGRAEAGSARPTDPWETLDGWRLSR
jgi:acetyl-CoA carboxylase biotin carboxylase subunit